MFKGFTAKHVFNKKSYLNASQYFQLYLEPDIGVFDWEGLTCVVLRMPDNGHVNGYVEVPENHPHYNMTGTLDFIPLYDVHGCITFNDTLDDLRLHETVGYVYLTENAYNSLSKLAEATEGKKFLGFDTAHSFDDTPYSWQRHWEEHKKSKGNRYRTFKYVEGETIKLAIQVLKYME